MVDPLHPPLVGCHPGPSSDSLSLESWGFTRTEKWIFLYDQGTDKASCRSPPGSGWKRLRVRQVSSPMIWASRH